MSGGDSVAGGPIGPTRTLDVPLGGARRVATGPDRLPDARRPLSDPFVAPALVLLATAAIGEGYQWLHLMPAAALRPSGLLAAVFVLPVTVALTRRVRADRFPVLGCAVVASAAAVPVLWVVTVAAQSTSWGRSIGADYLVLAVGALLLVRTSDPGRTATVARRRPHRQVAPSGQPGEPYESALPSRSAVSLTPAGGHRSPSVDSTTTSIYRQSG